MQEQSKTQSWIVVLIGMLIFPVFMFSLVVLGLAFKLLAAIIEVIAGKKIITRPTDPVLSEYKTHD